MGKGDEATMSNDDQSSQRRASKPAVLQERIASFIEAIRPVLTDKEAISPLWNEEIRYHFDNGRTAPTIVLYIAKYRAALKEAFGDHNTALAICNTKAIRKRLDQFTGYATTGAAKTVEESIEYAAHNMAGRKPRLQLAISDFIASLNGVRDQQVMRALWDKTYHSFRDKTPNTIIAYVTKYRNAVREAFGDDHPMLAIAGADPALYDIVRSRKSETIANKNGALIMFENWREVIARCTRFLESDDPLLIAIGLMGVTGRRPFEIFTQAVFEPAPFGAGQSKWSVLFAGQAKTKGRDGTKFGQIYEIPVLASSQSVLAAYRRLRAHAQGRLWDGMSYREMTKDVRINLRTRMQEEFSDIWPVEITPKPYGLRHLYAEIAYHQFAPRTVSKNSYLSAILGHVLNDLQTSLSYMTFCLPENAKEADDANSRMIKRTQNQVAAYSV